MKVLSLFDGMACGMLAMKSAGVEIEKYTAFEIDKYATETACHNFPIIEERGDVFAADFTEFEGVDFLVGGSPCTYWSIAQTKKRETVASGMGWELFSQYVRALREAKPRYFLYENNKSMSADIRASITATFGFEPICINSALVSAQNRQRLYWCGIRQADGSYKKADIDQPADRGILLKDILETGAVAWQDKSYNYTTRCQGACIQNTLERHQHTMVAEPVPVNATKDGKAGTLRATYYKDGIRNLVANDVDKKTCIAEPVKLGEIGNGGQGNRVYSVEGKAVAQAAQSGGMGSNTGLYAIPAEPKQSAPVYEVHGGKITVKGKEYPIKLADGFYIIRKLTVTECKRLQTVPDSYDFPVSKSQAYKMLGNGWTVEVIAHLIRGLLEGRIGKNLVIDNDGHEQYCFDFEATE